MASDTPLDEAVSFIDDTTLLDALRVLRDKERTEEERLVRAAIIGELERRHPDIVPHVDAWAENTTDVRTYEDVLIHHLEGPTP